ADCGRNNISCHESESGMIVKKTQSIGGIGLLLLAALIFLRMDTQATIPVAITLTVVGVVLVAADKKKECRS
ncbi:MAG: hypothetical protein ACO20W_02795, partial [Anaerohalosphaeraceae bacterium]